MSVRLPFLRRLAVALMEHAAQVLPSARAPWAEAMKHELDHIEGDVEALTWASGCVLASYVERSKVMNVLQTWYARGLLAFFIAGEALNMLFAPVLSAAYHLRYLRVAAFLGGFTPGDDYRRFIPVMNATPWWLNGLWVAASLLLILSLWQLLRKNGAAFLLFAAAWVAGTAGNLIGQSMPAYKEAFSFPTPLFTRDYLIPAVTALVPVFIAAALWAHSQVLKDDDGDVGRSY